MPWFVGQIVMRAGEACVLVGPGDGTWIKATGPFGGSTTAGIAYTGEGRFAAVNGAGDGYFSSDNGRTWTQTFNGASFVSDMASDGAGIAIAPAPSGSTPADRGYLRTTDGGQTWVVLPSPFGTENPDLVNYDNGVFYLVSTRAKLCKSTDGGLTWTTPTDPFSGFTTPVPSPFGVNGLNIVLPAVTFSPVANRVAISNDGGATWSLGFPTPIDLQSSFNTMIYDGTQFVVTDNSTSSVGAWSSVDGISWTFHGPGSGGGNLVYTRGMYFFPDVSSNQMWVSDDLTNWFPEGPFAGTCCAGGETTVVTYGFGSAVEVWYRDTCV